MPNAEIAAHVFAVCEDDAAGRVHDVSRRGWSRRRCRARHRARARVEGPGSSRRAPRSRRTAGTRRSWRRSPTAGARPSLPGLVDGVTVANGPEEVRHAARVAFRRGATQLKVMVSGGVISLTDELDHTQLTVAELRAAVRGGRGPQHLRDGSRPQLARYPQRSRGRASRASSTAAGSTRRPPSAMAEAGAALVPTLAVAHLMASEWQRVGCCPAAVVPRMQQVDGQMERSIGHRPGRGRDDRLGLRPARPPSGPQGARARAARASSRIR